MTKENLFLCVAISAVGSPLGYGNFDELTPDIEEHYNVKHSEWDASLSCEVNLNNRIAWDSVIDELQNDTLAYLSSLNAEIENKEKENIQNG